MNRKEKLKALVAKKKQDKKALEEATPPHLRIGNRDELRVFNLIRFGYPAQHSYLIGCSDLELSDLIPDKRAPTVRFIRWNLEKKGMIEKAGFKRELHGSKANVYVIANKLKHWYEVEVDEGTPD